MKVKLVECNAFSEEQLKKFKEVGISEDKLFTELTLVEFKELFNNASDLICVYVRDNIFELSHPYDY